MKAQAGYWPTIAVTLSLLCLVSYWSLTVGPASADPEFTLYQIRLPRLWCGLLLGGALGVAGSLLQLATRNPLSEPELLGINQSAVFAVVLLLLMHGESGPLSLLVAALAGGTLTGLAILLMTASGAFPRERLILAGLTLAFFYGSASSGLLLLKESDLFEILHWTAGKLSGADWVDVGLLGSALGVTVVAALTRIQQWNTLQLGDDNARNLGVDPVNRRLEMVALAVVLCAVGVAVAGPVGFVGIIVPHLGTHLAGLDYRRRLPLIILLGALLVSGSDLLARTVIAPAEIPVGVLTALVGAPYFLYRAQKL